MKNSIVSVVIPCYNQGKYLDNSIKSIVDQSFEDWQLVVVDDGSTDNTREVARSWENKDSRITYLYKPNGGLPSARNYGALKSLSKYIFFLDSDDWVAKDMLRQGVDFLDSNPDYEIFYGRTVWVDILNGINKSGYEYAGYKNLLLYGLDCRSIIRRDSFEKIQGFDEDFREGLEDWEFFVRLLYKNKKVYVSDDVLYFYRVNTGEITQSKSQSKKIQQLTSKLFLKNYVIYEDFFGSPMFVLRSNESLQWANRRLPQFAKKIQLLWQRIHG